MSFLFTSAIHTHCISTCDVSVSKRIFSANERQKSYRRKTKWPIYQICYIFWNVCCTSATLGRYFSALDVKMNYSTRCRILSALKWIQGEGWGHLRMTMHTLHHTHTTPNTIHTPHYTHHTTYTIHTIHPPHTHHTYTIHTPYIYHTHTMHTPYIHHTYTIHTSYTHHIYTIHTYFFLKCNTKLLHGFEPTFDILDTWHEVVVQRAKNVPP